MGYIEREHESRRHSLQFKGSVWDGLPALMMPDQHNVNICRWMFNDFRRSQPQPQPRQAQPAAACRNLPQPTALSPPQPAAACRSQPHAAHAAIPCHTRPPGEGGRGLETAREASAGGGVRREAPYVGSGEAPESERAASAPRHSNPGDWCPYSALRV